MSFQFLLDKTAIDTANAILAVLSIHPRAFPFGQTLALK
jgi:hypothetical protein